MNPSTPALDIEFPIPLHEDTVQPPLIVPPQYTITNIDAVYFIFRPRPLTLKGGFFRYRRLSFAAYNDIGPHSFSLSNPAVLSRLQRIRDQRNRGEDLCPLDNTYLAACIERHVNPGQFWNRGVYINMAMSDVERKVREAAAITWSMGGGRLGDDDMDTGENNDSEEENLLSTLEAVGNLHIAPPTPTVTTTTTTTTSLEHETAAELPSTPNPIPIPNPDDTRSPQNRLAPRHRFTPDIRLVADPAPVPEPESHITG
ncbi:MAG: hypothetical protein M1834_002635 [Cirrosporium novae-zelandiae]|nr:MAG: hypothetical protein M1834_002635 [Cirrosporium novae-zelandiae]